MSSLLLVFLPRNQHERQKWGITGDERAPFEGNSRTRPHLEDLKNGGAAATELFEIREKVLLKGEDGFQENSLEYPMHAANEQVEEFPTDFICGDLEEVRVCAVPLWCSRRVSETMSPERFQRDLVEA